VAGYPLTMASLNSQMGAAVVALMEAFQGINEVKSLLDDATRASDPILLELGYNQGEIDQARAGFAALANLDKIGHSAMAQPAPNDFWFDAKHLAGAQATF